MWESAPGMGLSTGVGDPLLLPNQTLDQAVAPAAADGEPADGTGRSKGWLTPAMLKLLSKLKFFYEHTKVALTQSAAPRCRLPLRANSPGTCDTRFPCRGLGLTSC